MNHYECLYILKADLGEEATRANVERYSTLVSANGGTIDSVDEWGKRRLAYPIDYNVDGYYVLMKFSSEPTLPTELERNFKINDVVLLCLVTRLDG